MTSDDTDEKLAEQFESWMVSGNFPGLTKAALKGLTKIALKKSPQGEYLSQITYAAWRGWQAATRFISDSADDLAERLLAEARAMDAGQARRIGPLLRLAATRLSARSVPQDEATAEELQEQWEALQGHVRDDDGPDWGMSNKDRSSEFPQRVWLDRNCNVYSQPDGAPMEITEYVLASAPSVAGDDADTVERGAKAIFVCHRKGVGLPWEQVSDDLKNGWRAMARACLSAAAEPSQPPAAEP